MPTQPADHERQGQLEVEQLPHRRQCRDLRADRADQHQRHGNRGRQDVKPDPQRHQRRAETGKSGDEAAGERAGKQDRVGGRRPSLSLLLDHCSDVYTTAADRYYRNRSLQQQLQWKRPDERNFSEDFPGLPRRVVGGLGVEEDASADAGGRASAGHADLYRPRRARASGQPVDRSRYAYRGHAERHQVRGSPRHRADRPQLWRHGRHRRRRPRARQGQAADLYRRLRAQRRPVAARSERGGAAAHAGTGEVRRRLARAAESDAAGYVAGRCRMADRAPRRHADQMLRDEAQAAGRRR